MRRAGKTALLFAVALAFFGTACFAKSGEAPSKNVPPSQRESLCFAFLSENLMTAEGGVRTNYLDKPENAELATGAQVLSESMGLLMLYAAESRDEALFQRALKFVEEKLDTGELLSYRYSPETGAYPVNAFLDDMRIIRALLLADAAFGGGYQNTALQYARRLCDTNVKDGRVYDMYDQRYQVTNGFVTLCYLDLDTMRLLSEHDPRWQEVFASMKELVLGGRIGDEFPLYQSAFDYASMGYIEGDVSTVQSLLTLFHLAQIGECPKDALDWLKGRLERGALYGTYHKDGTPADTVESTAIYALCAMLFQAVGDSEIYELCVERMERFQVLDEKNAVYGSFADANTMDLYAFDNLMALMAYRQGYGDA